MFRHALAAGLAALGLLALLGAAPAAARQQQTQTEATFLSYDADAHTITVEVRRTGRGRGPKPPPQLKLKRGQQATFHVKEGGSLLTSTVVKSKEGTRMTFRDLVPGVKVFVFWVPDEKDRNARFARSISVYVSAQEWKGGVEDLEVPAARAD
jgi:hypothetical protein